jgi:O-antigen ligase
MKMLALALLLATVVVFLAYAFNRLRLGRLFYEWLFFFAWLVIASLYSKSIAFALTCSISLLIAYLYAVYMAVWLSRTRAIEIMMLAALLMCVGSILVFYTVPSMGRMQAWTAGGVIGDIGRMKGLTGTANAIGVIAALGAIIAVLNYRTFGVFGKRLALLLIPSALACLVLSDNRGSMIALAATIWFVYVIRGDTNFKLLLSIACALVGGALLMIFSDEIFSILSRSGKTAEITDLSGRRSIWAVVIELWAERPIFGHGYTSGLWILPLDPRLFHVAAHTHNLFLELLFAGGIILVGIFLYAVCRTFLEIYRLRAVNEGALLFFILIRGLTEAGPFAGMIGYSGFATTVTIALVISKAIDARTRPPATKPLSARRAAPRLRLSRA